MYKDKDGNTVFPAHGKYPKVTFIKSFSPIPFYKKLRTFKSCSEVTQERAIKVIRWVGEILDVREEKGEIVIETDDWVIYVEETEISVEHSDERSTMGFFNVGTFEEFKQLDIFNNES